MKKCSKCQFDYADDYEYCVVCGSELESIPELQCKCGKKTAKNDKFCGRCGNDFALDPPQQSQP